MQEPFPNFPTEPPQKPAGEPLPPQEETPAPHRTAGSTSAKSITACTEHPAEQSRSAGTESITACTEYPAKQPCSTGTESITAGTEHAAE